MSFWYVNWGRCFEDNNFVDVEFYFLLLVCVNNFWCELQRYYVDIKRSIKIKVLVLFVNVDVVVFWEDFVDFVVLFECKVLL